MGKAIDYTGKKVANMQVGDRTEDTIGLRLSSAKWHVTCLSCKRALIKKYKALKDLNGCNFCHAERQKEVRRYLNLRAGGLR
jgi:hypothetical protein